MDYEGATFEGGEVRLDGNRFDNCTFKDTALQYDGGPVQIVGCRFTGAIGWHLGGALATGLSVIGTLYRQNHEQALLIVSHAMFPRAAGGGEAAPSEPADQVSGPT